MKVLYFHQYFSTPKGASGIRSYEMARRLVLHGHQVTIVCGGSGRGETGLRESFVHGRRSGIVDGIKIIEFDIPYSNADGFMTRSLTFMKFALRSIRLVFTQRYDVLFATTTPLTASIPGILARWLRHKPFVFEVRDLWPELPREMGVITNPVVLWGMGVLEWLSYRSAHRLVGLSPGIVEGIAKRGVPRERIAMIPNGCDLEIFAQDQQAKASITWRPKSVKASDTMAIFTGSHGIANGLEAVLDAALLLKQRGREDIKLVLIGQGKLKPELEARAEREGLDNVVFHDPVEKSRLAGLMDSADLGMQLLANVPAFYYGTSPNKFFDYIAAGLPVLNNYPGWLAEMIEEHRCGFTVTPDDSTAFADALEQAAANREQLQLMGQKAQALAEERFDRHILADNFVTWLEGAVDPSSPETASQQKSDQ